jgi:hypothetical protein
MSRPLHHIVRLRTTDDFRFLREGVMDATPSGLLEVRPVGSVEPVRIRPQTRVDWFLSLPQRFDVGMIGG